jgi:acetyltransferase-like isoleucine patch superfamily enzyme
MIDQLYWILKAVFRFAIFLLPVELVNRLFYFLPGRLVVDILKWYGADIAGNVKIMPPILFHNFQEKSRKPFQNLSIGADSFLGRDCFVDLIGKIFIENNVTIAMGVTMVTHMNVGNSSVREQFPTCINDITIQQGSYIGARATIIAPVNIGAGALIGAGSLVLHDVPPRSICAGVPAKVIRSLDEAI